MFEMLQTDWDSSTFINAIAINDETNHHILRISLISSSLIQSFLLHVLDLLSFITESNTCVYDVTNRIKLFHL
jgi:hypothetical protein